MKKKLVLLMLSSLLAVSMVACSSTTKDTSDNEVQIEEAQTTEYQGTWSEDYTRDEVKELNEEISERIINTCIIYGLENDYTTEETIQDENGVSVNDNHIYLDIEEPEANRLESMYYGFKQYGSDLASGQLIMKLGFNLDKEAIIEDGEFLFEYTSMSTFSEAFTGDEDRDYSKLNKEIYDLIVNGGSVEKIETNVDGLKETITITDEFLLYKLETKEYDFKNIN